MKVVLNTPSDDLLGDFLKLSKNNNTEIINGKVEKFLFDIISAGDVNAFIIDNSNNYSQKAIDFIKKKHPYIPVVVIGKIDLQKINNADIYVQLSKDTSLMFELILKSVLSYEKNFHALRRLTIKTKNSIDFENCVYDPNQRLLFYKDIQVAKLSEKTGGILEVLAMNYGKLVKRELILEKVWLKSDYFSSRSMDVYVSTLRKILKSNKIDVKIKNVSKVGLILQ